MKEYTVKVEDNGDTFWYLHGKRHREDGPAVELANGHKSWWLNGKRHREDGPAAELANGDHEWWMNGVKVTEEEVMDCAANVTQSSLAQRVESARKGSLNYPRWVQQAARFAGGLKKGQ